MAPTVSAPWFSALTAAGNPPSNTHTLPITTAMLHVVDAESGPAKLTYTLTAIPTGGYLTSTRTIPANTCPSASPSPRQTSTQARSALSRPTATTTARISNSP
ncbi:hypothetical protein [Azonexus hydrophilus]